MCATAMKYLALVAFFTFVAARTFAFSFAVAVAVALPLLFVFCLANRKYKEVLKETKQLAGSATRCLPLAPSTTKLRSQLSWLLPLLG